MQKHAYTIKFSPLPTSSEQKIYYDLSPVKLPYSEDFPLLHYHDRYEIGLCLGGEGMFLSRGIYYCLSEGDVIFIPPNANHYSRSLREDEPCVCRFAYIDASTVDSLIGFICKDEDRKNNILKNSHAFIPSVIRISEDPQNTALLSELIDACQDKAPNLNESSELRLALFIVEADSRFKKITPSLSQQNENDEAIATVSEYLSLNYGKQDTTADLARLCHLSESQLRRRFIKVYGIPPIAYKNLLRCKIASRLLLRTRLSVSEISLRVGYQDCSDFYRAFKKNYGCSPSEYRANKDEK